MHPQPWGPQAQASGAHLLPFPKGERTGLEVGGGAWACPLKGDQDLEFGFWMLVSSEPGSMELARNCRLVCTEPWEPSRLAVVAKYEEVADVRLLGSGTSSTALVKRNLELLFRNLIQFAIIESHINY